METDEIIVPHNFEAEQSVLGSILLEPELFENSRLRPACFHDKRHRALFKCFEYLVENEKPIDIVVIAEVTGKKISQFGGFSYLNDLASSIPSILNFKYYADIVYEEYLKRKMVGTLSKKVEGFADFEDSAAFIADIQDSVGSIADEMRPIKEFEPISDVLNGHDEVLYMRSKQKGLVGVKTVGTDLDKLTGGHQKQDLIIVAARPSVGKTAFMLNAARKAAGTGVTAAIFSLEMPGQKLIERLISAEGNIDGNHIKTGMLEGSDWERYTMSVSRLNDLSILIDDTPGITVQEIGAKVKKLKKKNPDLMIYIDYLQLISGGKKFSNDQSEVKFISKYLKRIARENDCPIMVISSLSRSCEQRQDKRPMLSDLRDSGQIEYDADDVIFLYRDDYYNKESEKKNVIEIILAKGRNTGTGTVEMVYMKNFNKFVDLDRYVGQDLFNQGGAGNATASAWEQGNKKRYGE